VIEHGSRKVMALIGRRTQALSFRIWGFGEGPALIGLLACTDQLDDPGYEQTVVNLAQSFVARPLLLEDHVAPAELLVALGRRHHDVRYLQAAAKWTHLVLHALRPVAGQPPVYRPDLFGLASVTWVDTMHTHGPGLAACGYPDEGVRLLAESCQFLQDDNGLFAHGYDVAERRTNGVHWGRGCGWALLGLVGIAAYARDAALEDRCTALLSALARHEEEGRWHTVVDDPSTPVENSVSALVAAGISQGRNVGVVGPEYADLAERALKAATGRLKDGDLPVSEATPVGDRRVYISRRIGAYPWGHGPLLLALAAHEGWELNR
jgi:unsaturated rhamnogalacturonyl hydrolase